MKSKSAFWWMIIVFMITFFVRTYLNFTSGLQIGNGGYYPLQIKTILERGELAFNDMSLLFWVNAFIVKIISTLTSFEFKETILFVTKIIDSLSTAFIVFPIFQIMKRFNLSKSAIIVIPLFVTLSFFTLSLTGSFQKNSLGFLWLFCMINSVIQSDYLKKQNLHFYLTFLFLGLTGLTHFGSFSFGLLFIVILGIIHFKQKALLPLIIISSVGMLLILLFDEQRFYRIIDIFHFVTDRPPPLPIYLIYGLVSVCLFFIYRVTTRNKDIFRPGAKNLINSTLFVILIITCPLFSMEFTHRLIAFLLIPISLLFIYLEPVMNKYWRIIVLSLFSLIALGSVSFKVFFSEHPSVTNEELTDLENMKQSLHQDGIIICKHNLEFWVAWSTDLDVCQVGHETTNLPSEYNAIYLLRQKREVGGPPGKGHGPSHFNNPEIPSNSMLIYSSDYFDLFQIP